MMSRTVASAGILISIRVCLALQVIEKDLSAKLRCWRLISFKLVHCVALVLETVFLDVAVHATLTLWIAVSFQCAACCDSWLKKQNDFETHWKFSRES